MLQALKMFRVFRAEFLGHSCLYWAVTLGEASDPATEADLLAWSARGSEASNTLNCTPCKVGE